MGLAAITAVLIAASPDVDAGTPDAGVWTDDPIYAKCPAAPQPVKLADGSFNLVPLRAARNACLQAACEDHRERLAALPPPAQLFSLASWLLAALIGIGAAAAAGYAVWFVRGFYDGKF